MIQIILVLLVIYYLALSLYAYTTAKKLFKKYKDYPRIEVPENVQSSVRMDFGKWNEK